MDKRRRTPLHFALGQTDRPAGAEAVALLAEMGASLMADENGMLVSCSRFLPVDDGRPLRTAR